MAYRAVGHRASDKSPGGVENRGKGTTLSINTNVPSNGRLNVEASSFRPATSANHFLLHDSEPDGPVIVSSERAATGNGNGTAKPMPAPIGSANGVSPTRAKVVYTTDVVPGNFVGGHYMKLQVSSGNYDWLFNEINSEFAFHTWIRTYFAMPGTEGKRMTLYISFDDVRRAATAREVINVVDTTADLTYVTQPEFAAAQKELERRKVLPATGAPSAFYDGQVMFLAKFDGPVTACKADGLEDQIREVAKRFGDVLAFGELYAKDGMARFRVEYTSIKSAKDVVKRVTTANPTDIGGWLVSTQELPDITSASNSEKDTGVAGRGTPFGSLHSDGSPTFVSPTGRTGWSLDRFTGELLPAAKDGSDRNSPINGGKFTVRHLTPPIAVGYGAHHQGRPRHGPLAMQYFMPTQHQQQLTAFREPYGRGRDDVNDHSQTVDPELIRQGVDVRTTLMLRNLPHDMTCHKLKDLLDASNFGEYDFSYVRIDYEKGASVGYGFVNFTSPEAIIKFIHAYVGRPWDSNSVNRRGAARLAEVSYATVQGLDCCIEKFRNSSVMTEFVDYRPKLWFTKESAPSKDLVGEQADFPRVNNESKHQRSLANATQIGLFPPQSRRGPGGAHRAGRSQFDRGTTAQQQEDMFFQMQQQMHQMQLAQAGHFGAHAHTPYPMPAMPPMAQPPVPYGALIPYHQQGMPAYANQGAVMAPQGFYSQPSMNMAPPMLQQQYLNGNSFNGNIAAGHRFPTSEQHAGNRPAVVPRSFGKPYDADNDPKSLEGDVDVGRMTGYFNPHEEEIRKQRNKEQ